MKKHMVKVLCELCNGEKKETVKEYAVGVEREKCVEKEIKCRACYGKGYYLHEAAPK